MTNDADRDRFKKSDAEDWTKIEDKILRKKIQDRLAKRKQRQKAKPNSPTHDDPQPPTSHPPRTHRQLPTIIAAQTPAQHDPQSYMTVIRQAQAHGFSSSALFAGLAMLFMRSAQAPISDHAFFTLPQKSFLRATIMNANMMALKMEDLHSDEAISPWTEDHPYPAMGQHALIPTTTQLRTRHHPWIDLLAIKSLRDNILNAELSDEDEDELCWASHAEGIVVWGEKPWDESGWEISQAYLDRWHRLVDARMIETSNRWRKERDLAPLVIPNHARIEEII